MDEIKVISYYIHAYGSVLLNGVHARMGVRFIRLYQDKEEICSGIKRIIIVWLWLFFV